MSRDDLLQRLYSLTEKNERFELRFRGESPSPLASTTRSVPGCMAVVLHAGPVVRLCHNLALLPSFPFPRFLSFFLSFLFSFPFIHALVHTLSNLKDVVAAYKSLLKEKQALELTVSVASRCLLNW